MSELLLLPDEALLHVLAYLSPRELFRCRVVCRRLRDFCLHRQLWNTAVVEDKGLLRAALSLAPCIGKITYCGEIEHLAALVVCTECIVIDVEVRLFAEEALPTSIVILKLSSLGGLKKLCLGFCVKSGIFPKVHDVEIILQTVYHLNGLQELQLDLADEYCGPLPAAWCEREVRPSLRKLVFFVEEAEDDLGEDPFVCLLLKTHADTLEEVHFNKQGPMPLSSIAKCNRLRSLVCPASADLSKLLSLPNLISIKLLTPNYSTGTLTYLRRTSSLCFVFFERLPFHPALPIEALSHSPSAARVESLSVEFDLRTFEEVSNMLSSVLPQFSSLRILELQIVYSDYIYLDDVLQAISPRSMPCLTTLVVPPPQMCVHAWFHQPALQDSLARNPQLRLYVKGFPYVPPCSLTNCPWCRWGCHKKAIEAGRCLLYARCQLPVV